MKRHYLLIMMALLLTGIGVRAQGEMSGRADYRIVPLPMSVQTDTTKTFTLQSGMSIAYDKQQPEMQRNAAFLQQWVEELTGIRLQLMPDDKKAAIQLRLSVLPAEQEAYTITVNNYISFI